MTDVIPVQDPKTRYRIEPTVLQAFRSPAFSPVKFSPGSS